MLKYLLFSNWIRLLIKWLNFRLVVSGRWLRLLFSRRRALRLQYLNVSDKYLFQNGYFAISYRFENAILYKFSNGKRHLSDGVLLLHRNQTFQTDSIYLTVYGFLQKRSYQLILETKTVSQLQTNTFQVKPLHVNSLHYKEKTLPAQFVPDFAVKEITIQFKENYHIRVNTNPIGVKHKSFNLNDFV